jgi:hypothetical protein
MNNLATAQTIYEAFGRGDVPAILELCSDAGMQVAAILGYRLRFEYRMGLPASGCVCVVCK